jgi:hypothetical protein
MSDHKFKEKRRNMFNDIISGSKGKHPEGSRRRAPRIGSTSESSAKRQRTSISGEQSTSIHEAADEVTGNEFNILK